MRLSGGFQAEVSCGNVATRCNDICTETAGHTEASRELDLPSESTGDWGLVYWSPMDTTCSVSPNPILSLFGQLSHFSCTWAGDIHGCLLLVWFVTIFVGQWACWSFAGCFDCWLTVCFGSAWFIMWLLCWILWGASVRFGRRHGRQRCNRNNHSPPGLLVTYGPNSILSLFGQLSQIRCT